MSRTQRKPGDWLLLVALLILSYFLPIAGILLLVSALFGGLFL